MCFASRPTRKPAPLERSHSVSVIYPCKFGQSAHDFDLVHVAILQQLVANREILADGVSDVREGLSFGLPL
jgi:hypothetical protein